MSTDLSRDIDDDRAVGITPSSDAAVRALWAGVMQCAISDLGMEAREARQRAQGSRSRMGIEDRCPTWAWFASESTAYNSFKGVCALFDMSPDRVRSALRARFFQ